MEYKNAERAISKFICGTSDRYRYSYQMLNEWVIEIESLLKKCDSNQLYQLLNKHFCDDNAYEPSPNNAISSLLRLLIVRIHNQCEIKPQLNEIKNKIRSLCQFTSSLISFGLKPMLPFKHYTINNASNRIFNGSYYGFSPRQSSPFEYNGYLIFNKLSESIDFCSTDSMADIYCLVFDIVATFKQQQLSKQNNVKPAIITLPIWKEVDDIHYSNTYPTRLRPPSLRREIRDKMGIDLHAIWLCGRAFLSMYGGSSPNKADFSPSVLALALDKFNKYADQRLFRFINMNKRTTAQYTLLPLTYDHKFVLEAELSKDEFIKTLKRLLDTAYNDVIVYDDGFYPHQIIILYIFLVKQFYDCRKRKFYAELKQKYDENRQCMPLIYDIVHMIVNEYYFENLTFVDIELDRTKIVSLWLTQLRKFSKEWQDWMAVHMLNTFKMRDMEIFRTLLSEKLSMSQYVVTGYKNKEITKWILLYLYDGCLNFEQMIEILCENEMNDPNVLKMVFNEERIDFFGDVRVGNLFKYVGISLILKSKYKMNVAMMKYMFEIMTIYKGYNCQSSMSRVLQKIYLTLCRFPSRDEEKLQMNNIRIFLTELKLHKEFDIDFDRGFIECVNFQNQNRPNIAVLQLLFDLELLNQEICRQRTYLQHSILFENTDILAIIKDAWKH